MLIKIEKLTFDLDKRWDWNKRILKIFTVWKILYLGIKKKKIIRFIQFRLIFEFINDRTISYSINVFIYTYNYIRTEQYTF